MLEDNQDTKALEKGADDRIDHHHAIRVIFYALFRVKRSQPFEEVEEVEQTSPHAEVWPSHFDDIGDTYEDVDACYESQIDFVIFGIVLDDAFERFDEEDEHGHVEGEQHYSQEGDDAGVEPFFPSVNVVLAGSIVFHFNLFQIQKTHPIEQESKYSIKKDKVIDNFVNSFDYFISLGSILAQKDLVDRIHLYYDEIKN